VNRWTAAALVTLTLSACASLVRAGAGDVQTPARRELNAQQITDTVPPPPTIRQTVNALPYQHYNDVPAMKAYRLVAAERGWSSQRIEAWAPFVRDVMLGESAFCWNRRRGDIVASYSMCVITRQGRYEDVGFGQVTTSFYGRDGLLCTQYGICSSAQILASPYDSMLWSLVVPIELDGSHPWCFNSRARAYHPTCASAPD
jgi:hypothetical protein